MNHNTAYLMSYLQSSQRKHPKYVLYAITLLTLFSGTLFAQVPTDELMAIVNGKPVYSSQLPLEEQAQLQRMQLQVYAVKLRALHSIVDPKLVETEASSKGLTTEQLAEKEIVSKVPDPTDEQVRSYYESRQGQIKEPYEEVKEKIRKGLKDLEVQKARIAYVQGLFQQALNDGNLVIKLPTPRVDVTADPSRLRGDPKAPITIVEFSDFSCPYCQRAEATMNDLLSKYPGKVKVAYRDFPLRQLHPSAQLAAEASRCASEQGKYWEYHDLLFADASKQNREGLIQSAHQLNLDGQKFEACLSSGRYKPQIEQDIQQGSRAGIIATPGFFINGNFINGAQPSSEFEKVIDQQLTALENKQAKLSEQEAAEPK